MNASNIIEQRPADASAVGATGTPSENASGPHGHSSRGRRLFAPISLQALAMLGIGALLYPTAANWFATLHHNSEISGYTQAVEQLPDADRQALLAAAEAYNATLPAGVLRDPYTAGSQEAATANAEAYAAYEEVLRVAGTDVIGSLTYAKLNIGLPIYHGTGEDSLQRGVGHLYGSSLPVGGASTHSVLTSHSGLINASLFTPLTKAAVGDTFQVTVLGETRTYQVDSIETVLPEDTSSLQVVAGEDRVTLVTCTPIGINSHRLLVHSKRIANPESTGDQTVAGDGRTAGFPWWAVVFFGSSGVMAWVLFRPTKSPSPSSSTTDQELDA